MWGNPRREGEIGVRHLPGEKRSRKVRDRIGSQKKKTGGKEIKIGRRTASLSLPRKPVN